MRDTRIMPTPDCGCGLCQRAAALDAMRQIEAARARCGYPADPTALRRSVGVALPLGLAFWLLVAALWLLARHS